MGQSIQTSLENQESVAQKMALGTKEDTSYIYSISSVDNTVQTLEFVVRKFGQFYIQAVISNNE